MMEGYVVGVDLGGTHVRAGLVDSRGRILRRAATETRADEGLDAVLDRIADLVHEVATDLPLTKVIAIALAVPGPVDTTTRVVRFAPNLGWEEVPVCDLLQERLGRPILVGNDANLAALGEHHFGAGRGIDHLIYITVSTGVGGGIIVGGHLLVGTHGYAAEIGHHIVVAEGPLCGCGNRGCLEAVASGTAIAREAREAILSGRPTRLREMCVGNVERVDARMVTKAARAGDEVARGILQRAGHYLGIGIVNLLYIFNPRRIILGGGVMNAGPFILEPMWAAIRERVRPIYLEEFDIVPAALGDDVGILGAAALAMKGDRGETMDGGKSMSG